MPPSTTSIKQVQTFPQLVKYLRDELEWPIESDNYDEISWDYDPAELGLKPNEAAKIDYIRQMRPLTDKQPFGIFFVKFSKGKLPVVALRRILSNLVVKRRASANKADRPAWEMNDLLFLSSWGEKEQRHMNFAHFADNDSRKDLPTLKVLDWAEHNTKLHVREVDQRLRQSLAWPEDAANQDKWRETWRGAFRLRHRETIDTAKALSIRLADLARAIRDRISDALAVETDKGPLTSLLTAFQQGLVHDLDADGFADMYAQTIAYGLLSARIADPKRKTADDFAAHMRTSPFLRELMETFLAVGGRKGKAGGPGIDFDELGVSEVVELLDEASMEAVVRDFGDRKRQEDPVIHFYELFLHEYNKELKIRRGVFYTPQPVVSYIVRSVHELLQSEFGLVDGLADTTTWGEMLIQHKDLKLPPLTGEPDETRTISPDEPFVQILDPATGTATFIVEVIDVIYNTMKKKWKQQGKNAKAIDTLWNDYVPQHLLPRLHAYELMMAPYAIAHMKIGLKLAETGYHFQKEERARVYLTNALEPWQKQLKLPEFDALAHEAAAVNEIKRQKRFTVIIGNPPYSSSICEPDWLMRCLDDWKQGLNEKKSDLNREEWKFLRFAQSNCQLTQAGIAGFIINRDFLDGIVKRRMREHLGQTFQLSIAVDLNGDVKGNVSDENVFDIEQGVAIAVLCTRTRVPTLRFASLVGTRAQKYVDLVRKKTIDESLTELNPAPPYYRWQPAAIDTAADAGDEYVQWLPLDRIISNKSSGIQTKNDTICIGWSAEEVFDRVRRLASLSANDARTEFDIAKEGAWTLTKAQADLRQFGISRENVRRILYRPLDFRFTYYTHKSGGFLGRPRYDLMRHMLDGKNFGLIFNRQVVGDNVSHFLVSRDLICHGTFYLGNKGQDYLAPLYLYADDLLSIDGSSRTANFTEYFTALLRLTLGHSATTLTPDDIFFYVYGVFHSPNYRSRYAEFLKIDFPRLPLTGSIKLFRSLANFGSELSALHLLEAPRLKKPVTKFIGKNPVVTKVGWTPDDGGTVWLDGKGTAKSFQPGTSGFRPVPKEIWKFHIGGYQVCEKWLKDRGPKKGAAGRTLSKDDIAHYHKIVIALTETIRLMTEIDKLIEQHGGWPEAFVTQTAELPKAAEAAESYDS